MKSTMQAKIRTIAKQFKPVKTSDGAGVTLYRSIGGPKLSTLDPFLLLDEFGSENKDDYIAGFPDHPHRGFSTVTYMLAGNMEHRDHKGNCGNLVAGSVQWMTAGRGIIHSEMPKQDEGRMWGFQLWVNLPAKSKMIDPDYQDIAPDKIPEVTLPDGCKIRVIAGKYKDTVGPVKDIGGNQPLYLDVTIPKGITWTLSDIPSDHNLFSYLFEGKTKVGTDTIEASQLFVYNTDGDTIELQSTSDSSARFLVVGGRPLNEPIARYGPFVMNTQEEIIQAFRDYQSGNLQK